MYQPNEIRNVAIISHGGAGKTTLTEAMLFNAKAVDRLGRVDNGTTAMDYEPDEIKRKMSVNVSLGYGEWKKIKVNMLDTPGYADFVGEVKKSLRIVEGCVVVIDATSGVEIGTEMVWQFADERYLSRCIFINKMEKEHADFYKAIDSFSILESSANIVLFQLPIGVGDKFSGIVDLIKMKAYEYKDGKAQERPMPPDISDKIEKYREKLIDAAAESDDALTEKYLEPMELSEQEIVSGLNIGIKNGTIVPVLCGCACNNIGVDKVLDLIAESFPSPADVGKVCGVDTEMTRNVSVDDPFCGLVFKIISDPHIGELIFFRAYSGSITNGMDILNASTEHKERIGHLCLLTGKRKNDVEKICSGDIGAIVKLKGAKIGDSLCASSSPIILAAIDFPQACISLAVRPKTKADQEKMGLGFHKISEEDTTFTMHIDHELAQTIISGMGETHLDVVVERLIRRFGTGVETYKSGIPYRETIKKHGQGNYKHKKQSGGRGQYGEAFLKIDPLTTGERFEFVNETFGGSIPAKYIPPVEKGVRDTMDKGILAGCRIINVKVTLYDGSFHDVDSSDLAFQIAGTFAFKKAFEDANPVLLEPIVEVECLAPVATMGEVIGDLNVRRGRILSMEPQGKNEIVKANVPQAEMYKYATALRSITRGRGSFKMNFSHYEEVPHLIAEKIIAEAKVEKEENH
ncbi:elongation factor G [Candidatus Desantisbacteria bacterium CG_4_8_14_3_um_filter_40_12]|uniref:Elongation factor G n=2 Tax=unclassified Candidatus Desantisiibacteriota TaxID=3106372 RepID=A0A2M7J9B6_9BACT|nr:MAG: elongation factor G [Candidatus Desantisbacteria bacterium CG_4_8_14_3_um_filter_40_12]PIY19036.1 MAG: elongation factor G [Candidatus Desantisbacteria bacterium CG_4_10_14_3_um_filter_40_18]